MTTFVDTSVLLVGPEAADHDPVVVVVRSAQGMLREGLGETDSEKFEKEFAAQYEAGNWGNVFDLLLGNAPVVFRKLGSTDEKEQVNRISKTAEGYFEVVLSVLMKLDTLEEVTDRISKFVKVMVGLDESIAVESLKLRLLSTLLNFFSPRTALRLDVVKALCDFAVSRPKQAPVVLTMVQEINEWMDLMEVDDETRCDLLSRVVSICETSGDKIKFLTFMVNCPTSGSATQLAVEKIRNPSTVASFEGITWVGRIDDGDVKKCVEIFANGNISTMESFLASSKSFLTKHNLSSEELMDKMRVLAFRDLAASSSHIPVSTIASALKTEDPLGIAIKAIRAGVIKGSINEVDGMVDVVAARSGDWKRISADVASLKKNI